jgi:hypothetical protein
MKQIAILIHKHDTFEKIAYFLNDIAETWREEGLLVTVLNGPGPRVEADLAILHVDLTVVPPDYLEFVRRYPVVINGRVVDISKRRINTNLVRRGDGYQGSVIVKTNQNCGGEMEARLVRNGPLRHRITQRLRERLPWGWRSSLSTSDYRIFDSVNQVPRIVWFNPDLVVERFRPERRDDYYCLRTWFFLGDQETNSISYSKQPIVKSNNVHHREVVNEVPDELRKIREDLGFDYGKFDYAIVDDRVVLYDANHTPTLGGLNKERFLPSIRRLAKGIQIYL